MLVSQDRILEGTMVALNALAHRADLPKDVIADLQVIAMLLRHTRHLEHGGDAAMRQHCARAVELLEELRAAVGASGTVVEVQEPLDRLMAAARAVQHSPARATELKREFLAYLRHLDQQLGVLEGAASDVVRHAMAAQASAWLTWQTSFDALGQDTSTAFPQASIASDVTTEGLQRFMAEKLQDPGAKVTQLTVLTGGFGKETSLFTVESEHLKGDLVMRRDLPVPNLLGLDCHDIKQEYPLLKALHQRGFPVPEPLWLETRSSTLPGPDFIIVRRVPGGVEGDALGGQHPVQDHLRRELAFITASIHALPPLDELGQGIPALDASLWQQSTSECVRRYIQSWYAHYLHTPHMPMPAVHHLFHWLLANVPQTDDAPALVHGDIGFHNLLIDRGQLSGVLDWEYAHIGDPAEDLGYIKNGVDQQIDWSAFLQDYASTGRPVPDARRILYFQIWANVRNAVGIAAVMDHFESGRLAQIRYGILPFQVAPHFIAQAESLIRQW